MPYLLYFIEHKKHLKTAGYVTKEILLNQCMLHNTSISG
jgi:hypothetical protein